MEIILTACDHSQNGFVALAQWPGLPEDQARRLISVVDSAVSDDSEPDNAECEFSFILDLMDGPDSCVDTGARCLPTQQAMRLAPQQVQAWLSERPEPDSCFFQEPPILTLASFS